MNYKDHIANLEHKKYKRFTQNVTKTIEDVQGLLYKDENGKAIDMLNNLIGGFKLHWCDFEALSDENKKAYEDLAKEILAEIGLSNNI